MPPLRIAAVLPALALGLGGCAALLDVRPLATGRSDVSAYELNGGDLEALRREARRLCPLGGEILRQAGQQQLPEATGGRWRNSLNAAAAWVDPPRQSAQLVVLCREGGEHMQLPAATPMVAAPASPAVPQADLNAALPVGPITPQW